MLKPDISKWSKLGKCEDHEDFFPPIGIPSPLWPGTRRALEICRECPVVEVCRDYAIEHEPYGTWGAMTAEDRAAARKRAGLRPLEVR